jgi:hypothetical protein
VIINNFETAKSAFVNVFGTKKLKIILIYRILATDVSFFWLISLPLLVSKGMPDRN